MALTVTQLITIIKENIGVIANGDALSSYRIGVEDVNSDEILTAVEAINTALQDTGITQLQLAAMVTDLAAIEVINAAIQTAVESALTDGTVTMAHTAPVIGNTTTLALALNANREYGMFINDSDEEIYIELGDDAVMNQGIRLNASGGSFEMSRKIGNLDTRVVNAICSSGTKVLLVTEGV